jgi:ankyrin repeat protein/Tfp pilus assembly protein PilF
MKRYLLPCSLFIALVAAQGVAEAGLNEELFKVVKSGEIEQVRQLLSKGADVHASDKIGFTPLHYASTNSSKEVAELLIARGADVNARDKIEYTPLHYASSKEVAELLIAKGADVNARDIASSIPLHRASIRGGKEVAELLIAKGADVNARNEFMFTPLHYASSKEVAELLIAKGADVNARDKIGNTPLHKAAANGNTELAKFLVAKGADVKAKNNNDNTPWMEATKGNHTELAIWLGEKPGDREPFLKEELNQLTQNAVKYGRISGSDTKRAVRLVQSMSSPPQIPEKASQYMSQGRAALKLAGDYPAFEDAESSFLKAALHAPWWPDAYFNLALVQEKLHKHYDAMENLDSYLAAAPDATDADAVQKKIYELEYLAKRKEQADKHINRGADLYRSGDYQGTIKENKEAIRLAHYYARAYANLGSVYTKLRRYQEAMPELKQALLLGDRVPYIYLHLSICYDRFGDRKKALSILEEGKSETEEIWGGIGKGNMLRTLARYYEEDGNYEKALENYKDALNYSDTDEGVDKEKVEKKIETLKRRLGR